MLLPRTSSVPPSKALAVTLMRDNVACFAEIIAPYAAGDLLLSRDHSIFSQRILASSPPLLSVASFFSATKIVSYLIAHGADMKLCDVSSFRSKMAFHFSYSMPHSICSRWWKSHNHAHVRLIRTLPQLP
jgi:hypothetical protein